MRRSKLIAMMGFAIVCAWIASDWAFAQANDKIQITVIREGWGGSDPDDVWAVCQSAAKEFAKHVPNRNTDPISVRYDAKRGPMVIFGLGDKSDRRVLLSSGERAWSQLVYQFAHEYCHIQCNYREAEREHLWFEESLCETASLFVLRGMAETWKTKAPYNNWKSYAGSLKSYADQRLTGIESLDGLTLGQWYLRNEPLLRKTGTNRGKNQVVAAALLPIFEKTPRYWQAVRYLHQGQPLENLTFIEYVDAWHGRVPDDLKPFVAEIKRLFSVP